MGNTREPLQFTRRDFGKLALAGLPLSLAFADVNSKFKGVQIGAITYSFRTMPNPEDIIKAYVTIGLGEMELMSGDAEKLAGAPIPMTGRGGGRAARSAACGGALPAAPPAAPTRHRGRFRAPADSATRPRGRGGEVDAAGLTPEEQAAADARAAELRKWRMSATEATFKPVKKKIEDAGIDLRILCYNMNVNSTKDDEIEYGFMMAKALGVKVMSTSTQVSMAKRTAPFADKHKIYLAYPRPRSDEESGRSLFARYVRRDPRGIEVSRDQSGHRSLHGRQLRSGCLHPGASRSHHAPAPERLKKDHGEECAVGTGRHADQGRAAARARQEIQHPGQHRVRYPGDPMVEIPKCLQYAKDALNA